MSHFSKTKSLHSNSQGIEFSPAYTRQLIAKSEKAAAHEHHHLHLKKPHGDAQEGQEQLDLSGFYALLLDADVNAVHDVSKVRAGAVSVEVDREQISMAGGGSTTNGESCTDSVFDCCTQKEQWKSQAILGRGKAKRNHQHTKVHCFIFGFPVSERDIVPFQTLSVAIPKNSTFLFSCLCCNCHSRGHFVVRCQMKRTSRIVTPQGS